MIGTSCVREVWYKINLKGRKLSLRYLQNGSTSQNPPKMMAKGMKWRINTNKDNWRDNNRRQDISAYW